MIYPYLTRKNTRSLYLLQGLAYIVDGLVQILSLGFVGSCLSVTCVEAILKKQISNSRKARGK